MPEYDLSEREMKNPQVKSEVKTLSLDYVIEQMLLGHYDFEPPYQRGKVWHKSFSVALFKSICDSTPIGAIHLVKKYDDPTCSHMWVLDAKQRLSSIEMFVKKGSTMRLRILDGNGVVREVSWKEISENPKSKFRYIYDKIKTYQVTIVIWDHCDFETQGMIFNRVNNSVPLNSWERIYGNHFIVKNLLQYIFHNYFLNSKFLQRQQAEDRRNSGIQLVHSILCICFGYEINDIFATRAIAAKNLEDSCKKLERFLSTNQVNALTQFDDPTIEKLGLSDKLDSLQIVVSWFEKALNYKNNLKNKFEAGFVLDTLTFLVKKFEAQILTTSVVEQNFDKMHKFVSDWLSYKNASATPEEKQRRQAIKSRSTHPSSIKFRQDAMEEIFKLSGFDNVAKNNKVTSTDRTLTILNSPPVDPINGMAFSDENIEIDHVVSTKISDTTPYVALTDVANRRKSDQTLDTLKKTEEYVRQNS